MPKGGGLPTVGRTHVRGTHPMHKPLFVLAGAPRLLAWVSLMAISTSIAYAMTAVVSVGQPTDASGATLSVASRTISAAGPEALALAQNPAAEMQAMARLRPMLAERGFGPDVIDGPMMARAPSPNGASILDFLPVADQLPEGCFVVLTGRKETHSPVRRALERVRVSATGDGYWLLQPTVTDAEHLETVRAYLRRRMPSRLRRREHVEEVLRRSGGIFLYASHYSRALNAGAFRETSNLPRPDEFYPAYLARLSGQVGELLFRDVYLPTLALLAAAGEPVRVRSGCNSGACPVIGCGSRCSTSATSSGRSAAAALGGPVDPTVTCAWRSPTRLSCHISRAIPTCPGSSPTRIVGLSSTR